MDNLIIRGQRNSRKENQYFIKIRADLITKVLICFQISDISMNLKITFYIRVICWNEFFVGYTK